LKRSPAVPEREEFDVGRENGKAKGGSGKRFHLEKEEWALFPEEKKVVRTGRKADKNQAEKKGKESFKRKESSTGRIHSSIEAFLARVGQRLKVESDGEGNEKESKKGKKKGRDAWRKRKNPH